MYSRDAAHAVGDTHTGAARGTSADHTNLLYLLTVHMAQSRTCFTSRANVTGTHLLENTGFLIPTARNNAN
jgi:hypothetical protein